MSDQLELTDDMGDNNREAYNTQYKPSTGVNTNHGQTKQAAPKFTQMDYDAWLRKNGYPNKAAADQAVGGDSMTAAYTDWAKSHPSTGKTNKTREQIAAEANERGKREQLQRYGIKTDDAAANAKYDPQGKATNVNDTSLRDKLHEKLLKAQCSKDDLQQIYRMYVAGKWPWGIGPQTQKWFKYYNFANQNPTQTAEEKAQIKADIDKSATPKPSNTTPQASGDAWRKWAATKNGQDYRKRLAHHLDKLGVPAGEIEAKTNEIMQAVFNTHGDRDAMRKIQAQYSPSLGKKFDISGKGRTDNSVARGIAANWTQGSDGSWSPKGTAVDKAFLAGSPADPSQINNSTDEES